MKEKKIYMENLIFICNNFENEECMELFGQIVSQKENNTLKTLILSKNLISTTPITQNNQNPVPTQSPVQPDQNKNTSQTQAQTQIQNGKKEKPVYFRKFMESLENSNLEELFLISCGIGKNDDDVDILCDMLSKNTKLISLRLFGNEIKTMDKFRQLLGIFSEYNNNLKNSTLKSLDLSKNQCTIEIKDDFLDLIDKLRLEYLDINQNTMNPEDKETFRKRTNELTKIKIIY